MKIDLQGMYFTKTEAEELKREIDLRSLNSTPLNSPVLGSRIVPGGRFRQMSTLAQLTACEHLRNAIILRALAEMGLAPKNYQSVVELESNEAK